MHKVSACAGGFLLRCGYDVVWEGHRIIQPPEVSPNCLDPPKDPVLHPLQAVALGQRMPGPTPRTPKEQAQPCCISGEMVHCTNKKYFLATTLKKHTWKFKKKLKIEENAKHLPWASHIGNGPCKARHRSWKIWDGGRFTHCNRS